MNIYMFILLQIVLVAATIIYGVIVYKIFTRSGYRDEDSSVLFSVFILLSGVLAFAGFSLFFASLADGLLKIIVPSDQMNMKQQSLAIIAVTIFFTYSFLIIKKRIADIRSVSYQKGLNDAKKLTNQKDVFGKESELEDYDKKALEEAIQRMRVDIEEDGRINGRKSKDQILKEREGYFKMLGDLASKKKRDDN